MKLFGYLLAALTLFAAPAARAEGLAHYKGDPAGYLALSLSLHFSQQVVIEVVNDAGDKLQVKGDATFYSKHDSSFMGPMGTVPKPLLSRTTRRISSIRSLPAYG